MHALQNSIQLADGSFKTPRYARLFSLISIPSLQLRYFPIVKQGFHSMWHNCNLGAASNIVLHQLSPEEDYYRAYFWLFDFEKLGCVPLNADGRPFSRTDPLRRTGLILSDIKDLRRGKFNLLFSSDSTGTSFDFVKTVPPAAAEPVPLEQQYIDLDFNPEFDYVGFADPGVRDPFNLYFPELKRKTQDPEEDVDMEDEGPDEYELDDEAPARIVTMSTKEFYHLSGRNHAKHRRELYLKQHDQDLEQASKLEFINSQCPTPKALDTEGFFNFFFYKIQHLDLFIDHYDRRYRVLLMRNYIGKLFISISLTNLLFQFSNRQTTGIGRSL
jgi:hypothetical protein